MYTIHYNTKCYIVLKKTRWDTFWAVFSQTHLVTLVVAVGAEGFLLIEKDSASKDMYNEKLRRLKQRTIF
jgi:hypothetical protein